MLKSFYREHTSQEEVEALEFLRSGSDLALRFMELYHTKYRTNIDLIIKNKAKGKYYSIAKYNDLIITVAFILEHNVDIEGIERGFGRR